MSLPLRSSGMARCLLRNELTTRAWGGGGAAGALSGRGLGVRCAGDKWLPRPGSGVFQEVFPFHVFTLWGFKLCARRSLARPARPRSMTVLA